MRLNKSTSHAIRILIDCAQADGTLVKLADLSERLDITQQNVFKIASILSRAGLLAAMRGRYGGVRLSRPASDIRVGDVVRAMESTQIELDSDGKSKTDRQISAGVNHILDSAKIAFISILDRHTLADLAAEKRAPDTPRTSEKVKKRKALHPVKINAVKGNARRLGS
jgi:Rrf2 family protein